VFFRDLAPGNALDVAAHYVLLGTRNRSHHALLSGSQLFDGIEFVVIAVGVFGLGSIIADLEKGEDEQTVETVPTKISRLWPTCEDFRLAWPASVKGTALGCVLGVLPGGGAVLASFAAYALERKVAKDPSRFGKGAIEGVAAPESASNARVQAAFVPMLTLGIPPNAVMAIMVGAMMIHGVRPGLRLS
jgi:putative tricarboxylic transport membrane protein